MRTVYDVGSEVIKELVREHIRKECRLPTGHPVSVRLLIGGAEAEVTAATEHINPGPWSEGFAKGGAHRAEEPRLRRRCAGSLTAEYVPVFDDDLLWTGATCQHCGKTCPTSSLRPDDEDLLHLPAHARS
jgi:hypothetical protein